MRCRWFAIAIAVVIPFVASCAGDHEAEPTIPSVNFAPRLVVVVNADDLGIEPGERAEGVGVDPPSVPSGSVIEIRNADTEDHRITVGTTIDTGIMRPGDTTTVVMTTEGEVELTDADDRGTLVITVTPRADER